MKLDLERNARRAGIAWATLSLSALAACAPNDPCGDGFGLDKDGLCQQLATASATANAPSTDAGTDADASATPAAAPAKTFGKTCAAMADCGGDAPICGAPQLPYCTQINCAPGEANAGICPSGFQCISTSGNPSVCLGQ